MSTSLTDRLRTITQWVETAIDSIWWKYVPGTEFSVPWPSGWTPPINGVQTESSDPNDHYRPVLEEHVGRQGWDWNWRLQGNDISDNRLTIKVRRGKERWATFLAMKWN